MATGETNGPDPGDDGITDRECEALHEVELGLEWLQRAQGHLLQFHHATGHAMDHLRAAEEILRECGHADLADDLRDRHLPRGVTEEDRWSYAVVEGFKDGVLDDVSTFEGRARDRIADGRRHVAERRQEREWRDRARD
ncbi:hypothetical protein BRD00_11190 [Halobacteriales archaeon QS_8_69_26]|nr:MAG: hypothetical protein BRD00_11190 [Halobacteriales archaeon QS_8_69_26]